MDLRAVDFEVDGGGGCGLAIWNVSMCLLGEFGGIRAGSEDAENVDPLNAGESLGLRFRGAAFEVEAPGVKEAVVDDEATACGSIF